MCQAAWAATHTNNTYLSAFYRRIMVRKGAQKAVMALAHHLITIVYNVLARNEEYVELGGDYYDRQNKPKVVSRLVARLTRLGYNVDLTPVERYEPPPVAELAGPAAGNPSERTALVPAEHCPPINTKKKRGRPCKCAGRGIICKHGTSGEVNSLIQHASSPARFS